MKKAEEYLKLNLEKRKGDHLLRSLKVWPSENIDFYSNDYLGLTNYNDAQALVKHGSGGSRLIAGNHAAYEQLEHELSHFYKSEGALLFNSGFDANLALFSCIPQKGDVILYDALIHNSIRQGMRLSAAQSYKFKHNDLVDLKKLLDRFKTQKLFIAVESIYSMDGDYCDIKGIVELAEDYDAAIILDEAHSNGIDGPNGEGIAVSYQLQNKIFARMLGMGKALGRHGAVVVGSANLKQYLVNFASSFIYSTAMSPAQVQSIKQAFGGLKSEPQRREKLQENIQYFQHKSKNYKNISNTSSPIQCIKIPGNEAVKAMAAALQAKGINIVPVLSPTVERGSERLRVCLHSFNTKDEIDLLLSSL